MIGPSQESEGASDSLTSLLPQDEVLGSVFYTHVEGMGHET